MEQRTILTSKQVELTINRLCFELIENHNDFSETVIIGLQPRGVLLADRICKKLNQINKSNTIQYGKIDITFYRDDFRRRDDLLKAGTTQIDFLIENKRVVLVDDVLFTGRTIRAGLDAMLDFGRPKEVELLVLIDRRFSRHLPIQPDYVGKTVDSVISEKVIVEWKEKDNKDQVILFTPKK